MGNPRLPAMKADVSGAAIKNPQRHKDRKAPKGTRPIGEPYVRMSEDQQAVWHELRADLPWLNSSHRTLLRLACILTCRLDDADVGVSQIQTLSAVLSKLGATPVDETKVSVPDEVDGDPEDRFFGRPN